MPLKFSAPKQRNETGPDLGKHHTCRSFSISDRVVSVSVSSWSRVIYDSLAWQEFYKRGCIPSSRARSQHCLLFCRTVFKPRRNTWPRNSRQGAHSNDGNRLGTFDVRDRRILGFALNAETSLYYELCANGGGNECVQLCPHHHTRFCLDRLDLAASRQLPQKP